MMLLHEYDSLEPLKNPKTKHMQKNLLQDNSLESFNKTKIVLDKKHFIENDLSKS